MARLKGSKNKKIVTEEAITPTQAVESEYTVSMKVLGKIYSAKGATVLDALKLLVIKNPKGKTIMTVEKGEIKKDKILMPFILTRLFASSPMSREIALKNTSLLFGGF